MAKSTYTSDELFHFVGRKSPKNDEANYQTLLTVLRSGRISHPPHENSPGKISYTFNPSGSLLSEDLIMPTVTCFCDIPKDHLPLHLEKYGKFGLSFKRETLIFHGARPVIYIPVSRTDAGGIHGIRMLKKWEATFFGFREHITEPNKDKAPKQHSSFSARPDTPEAAIAAMKNVFEKDFLAFVKPFNADLADDDPNNYYLEREWRRYGNLDATPETVNGVWVSRGFEDRLREAMPAFAKHIQRID